MFSFLKGKNGGRTILNSVSGRFKAGELSGILGPSGAGKSSLLNAISGYRSKGVSGQLKVNGQPRDENKFRKMSCYISQDDLLQPMLTLNEMMMFAADLKLRYTRKQRKAVVNEILHSMGLTECRHTRTESLSGGQKKRLAIALELLNNPPLFFLDEPTSGLDTVTTTTTLKLLRTLAHQGRTVVCTIHQPSATMFAMFDHVYVLSAGLCVYQGATEELVSFLSSVGLHCPTHYNPADFVIEMTDGEDEKNIQVLSKATANGKVTRFRKTTVQPEGLPSSADIESGQKEHQLTALSMANNYHVDSSDKESVCIDFTTSGWSQFCTLYRRMFLQIRRNGMGLKLQLYHHFLCALIIGIVFYDQGKDGGQFFNHMKYCMGVIVFHTYTHVMVPVLTFPYEVKLLCKEHFNRWYGLKPYFIAMQLSKMPTLVVYSLLFLCITYYLTGLPMELHRLTIFCIIGVTVSLISEGMGLAIGSVFSVTNGCAVGPMSLAPFVGFAIYGFDFAKNIPFWIKPILNTSFLRSGVIALIIDVYGMNRKRLECHEMYCHFKNPKVALHYLNLDNVSVWTELFTLFVMLLIFRFLCYSGLRWRVST